MRVFGRDGVGSDPELGGGFGGEFAEFSLDGAIVLKGEGEE